MQRLCPAKSSVSPTPLSGILITLCKFCSTVLEQGTNAKRHLINFLSTDGLPKALSEGIVNISHQNLSWKTIQQRPKFTGNFHLSPRPWLREEQDSQATASVPKTRWFPTFTMETTLSKEEKQTSHVSWHLGQGHRPCSKWTCPGNVKQIPMVWHCVCNLHGSRLMMMMMMMMMMFS